MKKYFFIFFAIVILLFLFLNSKPEHASIPQDVETSKNTYWLLLERKSNIEYLYSGIPGDRKASTIIKKFTVKTGIPGDRPTPLPQLLGREYWLVTGKFSTIENPETSPYFLTLDIPYSQLPPYGPEPYTECNGQCNWVTPGSFGLHGIHGDITYLYTILDPENSEIRYYIRDL